MIALVIVMYLLVLLDTSFSGVCAASGRNALIRKRAYYLRSMWHGALWGQAAILMGLFILLVAVQCSGDEQRAIEEVQEVGWRMATAYSIYAAIVMTTFLVRVYPSVDIRSITSTVGFGPLTLIRPAVIVLGIFYATLARPGAFILLAAIAIGLMMIPFRVFLNVVFARMSVYCAPAVSQRQLTSDPGN